MRKTKSAYILGIEGGGTRSVALLSTSRGKIIGRAETGPCNIRQLDDDELRRRLLELADRLGNPRVARAAICLAGCRTHQDSERVQKVAAVIWPWATIRAADDLISGLIGGLGKPVGILIISGTGSCVFGQNARGGSARAGGWGHILGDGGSGYQIGLFGLRSVIRHYDDRQSLSSLGQRMFARLGFHQPEDAVDWIHTASKAEVAALASDVFADEESDRIIQKAAQELVEGTILVADRLGFGRNQSLPVCLSGGVFAYQPRFFERVARNLRKKFPHVKVVRPQREGAYGALRLALKNKARMGETVRWGAGGELAQALTEQRNKRTMNLDQMGIAELVDAMLAEEETVAPAVRKEKSQIATAVRLITHALKRGGRLFYVGAGTSGRLGILDASECPPTFGVEPDRVQGIIAGGPAALMSSVEAAEDDPGAGTEALRLRGLSRRDVVCGISASGRTPFVLGALEYARKLGAKTIFLTFNPKSSVFSPQSSVLIHPATGPEVIAGSTRLKAGTATKLILNMLTTISMIRLGKVRGNLMASLRPISSKLRDRAIRIVITLCHCSRRSASVRLERAGWNLERAIAQKKKF